MALPNITIDGRLVADPEMRQTGAGKAVCGLRVAASDSKKDDQGNWQTTEQIFINVTLWEAEAEVAQETYAKGDRVLVTGRIFQREYEKSDGSKGYSLEVKFPTVAKIPTAPRQSQQSSSWGQQGTSAALASDPWATAPSSTGGASNGQPPF